MKFDEKGRWIEPTDQQAWSAGKKWLIFGFIGVLLLSVGGWALGVALSGPAGRGEQIKQINRAENRTFAQEQFVQLLNDVKAYDQQIGVQQAALDAHQAAGTERDRLAQVVAGLKTQCISTTQQYNAEAGKISKRQFLEANLPEQINSSDPETDCK